MGKATQDLRNEHEAILHVFQILDAMRASDTQTNAEQLQFGGELVNFLKIFADKCHHGKEENYLFTALEAAGVPNANGPIGQMLHEHVLGRQHIAEMAAALAGQDLAAFKQAALDYQELLRGHIAKENEVLFVLADRILDEEKQSDLFENFETWEEQVVGHGVHEALHAQIETWGKEYLKA
jgi:hemerythrin-like domain-containing protein